MGKEIINFSPKALVQEQVELMREQNKELRNTNKLLERELKNGMSGLLTAAQSQFNITSFNPLFQSTIAAPITLNYTFLSYFYKTHGIIQTAIEQPVLDALSGGDQSGAGVQLHSKEMDEQDIERLLGFMEDSDLWTVVANAVTWARLYGGGAIIVNDGGKFDKPLTPDMPIRTLQLYAASRWELGSPHKLDDKGAHATNETPWEKTAARESEFYDYYGQKLHKSRVITINGKEAPWLVRWQLQGWGMSEVERMVEDFNMYVRTRNVLFDLLNEAKVDVFAVDGMRELLITDGGEQKMLRRIQMVQQAKNMNNALIIDKNDLYEQKQITFAGIADVMKENRMAIASAVKMPISKIFGVGASGFSSGEDDLENYNSMVQSSVRNKIRMPIRQVLDLVQRYLWGDVFDYTMKFKPLRIMSAKDEEEIRDKKFNRVMGLYDRQLMDSQEVGEACHKDTLIDVDTKAQQGLLEEHPINEGQENQDSEEGDDKEKDDNKE